jgi:Tol biopolymer transport system component
MLAYVVRENGLESLWVKQSETSASLKITEPANVVFDGIAFSPDSNFVTYITDAPNGATTLQKIDTLGGTPQKMASDISGMAAYSPDGSRISFIRNSTKLMTANADGTDIKEIAASKDGERWMLSAWSPDSKRLVTAVFSAENSFCKLVEVSLADGSQKQLDSPQWLRISGLAWLPNGKGFVLTARDLETTLSQIWNVSYPGGEAVRITNDLSSYQGLSLSADGSVIASVQENRNANIWRTSENGSVVQVTKDIGRDEGMSGVSAAVDGSIVYTTRIKGEQDISIVSPNGQNRQLTQNSRTNFSPVFSPDGKYIIFVSTRAENPTIWRMDIDGENEIQLTKGPGMAGEPQVTPDGKYVIFDQTDLTNKTTIWRVGMDGSDPQQISDLEASRPIISPDGKYIACAIGLDSPAEADKIVILPIEGGAAKQVLDIPDVAHSRNFRWTSDGKAFVYLRNSDKVDNLWRQPLSGGEPSAITNFDSMSIYRFSPLADGSGFAISRGSETSDAVLISRF